MKLRLPRIVMVCLTSILSASSIFAETQKTLSQDDITPDYSYTIQDDVLFTITGDIDFSETDATTRTDYLFLRSGHSSEGKFKLTFKGDGTNHFSMSNNKERGFSMAWHLVFSDFASLSFNGNNTFSPVLADAEHLLFKNIAEISFVGNTSAYFGGAIGAAGVGRNDCLYVTFQNIGKLRFADNTADLDGGAIRAMNTVLFENIKGDISFVNNRVLSLNRLGGAIHGYKNVIFSNTKNILFENNKMNGGQGGAINAFGGISFINTGNVDFLNNTGATSGGGAILSTGDTLLSADNGNITFKGNTLGSAEKEYADGLYVLNATGAGVNVTLRAQTGRTINFYDPFNFYDRLPVPDKCSVVFNKTPDDLSPYNGVAPDFGGTIRFSGAEASRYIRQVEGENDSDYKQRLANSRYSEVRAAMHQYGGTVLIEEEATLGARPEPVQIEIIPPGWGDGGTIDKEFKTAAGKPKQAELVWSSKNGAASFSLHAGTLSVRTGGILSAEKVTFSGKDAILSADGTGSMVAGHVDLSQGFSFDFQPFLKTDNSGLLVTANSLTLGGSLGIADKNIDLYTDNSWANNHRFLVLDTINVSNTNGTLEGIASNLTGTAVIDSPYAYNGTWTYEWKDSNNDGINDQLYAIWTPRGNTPDPDPNPNPPIDPEPPVDPVLPGIKDVAPELAGEMIPNSLWSSISNLNALSTAALGQLGIQRFHLPKDSNYWASGLGDFSCHNAVGQKDGYDYNGGGYAVGADTRLCRNLVGGIAFGNLFGTNKSRNYNAQIKQVSYAGMFYAAGYKELDSKNLLILQGQASYGYTENKLTTAYNDGDSSRGNWDNNTFFLSLQGSWDHSLENNWTLSPFAGIEYSDASQSSFTETGDKARRFGQGHLRNLSLPVGIALTKLSHYSNGMIWLNRLSTSYVPDVYRENPEADAQRLSNGFQWSASGVSPARNAIRINWETRLLLNEKTSIFAGYSLEGRNHSLYQRINAGISTTF